MASGIFDSNVAGTPAVSATGTSGADGIDASSDSGDAVSALSQSRAGVYALGPIGAGVHGESQSGVGVEAISQSGVAVSASSTSGPGVEAISGSGPAVFAVSDSNSGVYAQSNSGIGVHAVGGGASPTTPPIPQLAIFAEGGPSTGVLATSQSGTGVQGQSDTSTGVSGITESGFGVTANGGSGGVALQVIGKVEVQGNSVGSVTMAAGKKTLTVNNAAATANSLILLTPLNNPQVFLWIGARKAGSFTIDASKALPTHVTIMFLIIN